MSQLLGGGAVDSNRPGTGHNPARRPRQSGRSIVPLVEALGPPISDVAWSPDLVVQTLEVLAVALRDGELFWFKPVHAESLRFGLPRSAAPGEFVLGVLEWYPLVPRVVHSTSWRHEEGRVILTYVAVVEPPEELPPGSLIAVPVKRAEIARGEAMAPPRAIDVAAVLEHALRHVAWLMRDDQAIAAALQGWHGMLDDYQPEPFRALG